MTHKYIPFLCINQNTHHIHALTNHTERLTQNGTTEIWSWSRQIYKIYTFHIYVLQEQTQFSQNEKFNHNPASQLVK